MDGSGLDKSLVSLGSVIAALLRHDASVGYRDSALTMLLKGSLGGAAKSVLIAAIGPAGFDYWETLCTLRFAGIAKVFRLKVSD